MTLSLGAAHTQGSENCIHTLGVCVCRGGGGHACVLSTRPTACCAKQTRPPCNPPHTHHTCINAQIRAARRARGRRRRLFQRRFDDVGERGVKVGALVASNLAAARVRAQVLGGLAQRRDRRVELRLVRARELVRAVAEALGEPWLVGVREGPGGKNLPPPRGVSNARYPAAALSTQTPLPQTLTRSRRRRRSCPRPSAARAQTRAAGARTGQR